MNYWNPEINEELEGILLEKQEDVGVYKSKLYKIETDDGIVNVWGKKQLDAIMQSAKIGDKILIKYVGLKEVNDYQMKIYELEILNGNY